MSRKRRRFGSSFKAKVAIEAVKEIRTITELAKKHKLPDDYITTVREVANRQVPTRQIIKAFTAFSTEDHERMKNHFGSAVKELADAFGSPDQVVSAGEVGYPNWLASQHVAVWERGTGKLYFALVDCRPKGEALVVGWWDESIGPLEPLVLASQP